MFRLLAFPQFLLCAVLALTSCSLVQKNKPDIDESETSTVPVTGSATDTGFELTDVPSVVTGPQLLIDCLECGQDHEWGIDDAMLGGDFGEALDRARTGTVS